MYCPERLLSVPLLVSNVSCQVVHLVSHLVACPLPSYFLLHPFFLPSCFLFNDLIALNASRSSLLGHQVQVQPSLSILSLRLLPCPNTRITYTSPSIIGLSPYLLACLLTYWLTCLLSCLLACLLTHLLACLLICSHDNHPSRD